MKKCLLGDVADVKVSGVDKKTNPGEVPVRLCNYTDVYYNWAVTENLYNEFMVASAKPEEIKKFSLQKGQVAITKDSETRDDIGHPTYIADEFNGVLLGYHCALITPRQGELDGRYLNLVLRTRYAADYFANNAGGSGQRYYLNDTAIKELPLFLPIFKEQARIGRFFSALDRKIALNRRKIATLEKMAKEIYDYWFVQYDFPDANGRPYKSSGGEMVYSPELKREIPKGWKACSINDCGRFCRGVAYTRSDERPEGENTVLVMRGNNISEGHIIDDSNRVYVERELVSDEQYLNKFEVLFAMSSGSKEHVGKAAIGYDYPRGAAFGAFCSKFVPEGKYRYVVYSFLASAAYRSFIKQVCAGTGINNLKSEHFDVPLLAFPLANELLDRFNAVCAPLYESIFVATQDTERMESLRGFSLPLLMNGQVKVGE